MYPSPPPRGVNLTTSRLLRRTRRSLSSRGNFPAWGEHRGERLWVCPAELRQTGAEGGQQPIITSSAPGNDDYITLDVPSDVVRAIGVRSAGNISVSTPRTASRMDSNGIVCRGVVSSPGGVGCSSTGGPSAIDQGIILQTTKKNKHQHRNVCLAIQLPAKHMEPYRARVISLGAGRLCPHWTKRPLN